MNGNADDQGGSPISAYAAVLAAGLLIGFLRLGVVDEYPLQVVRGARYDPHDPHPMPLPPFAVVYQFGTLAAAATVLAGVTFVAGRSGHWSHWLTLGLPLGLAYLVGRTWLWWILPTDIWPPLGQARAAGLFVTGLGVFASATLLLGARSHIRSARARTAVSLGRASSAAPDNKAMNTDEGS